MTILLQVRAMASYNQWMNVKLYEACATLSDEQRRRDVGAFFKSIHGTLNHILLADRIWMGRFTGQPATYKALDEELYSDFQELRVEREKEDARIVDWAGDLTDEMVARTLSYTGIVSPQPRQYPMWFAIAHFFNHQTHHRGQITTLLSQQGVDPGVTDLIMLPEFQEP